MSIIEPILFLISILRTIFLQDRFNNLYYNLKTLYILDNDIYTEKDQWVRDTEKYYIIMKLSLICFLQLLTIIICINERNLIIFKLLIFGGPFVKCLYNLYNIKNFKKKYNTN